VPPPWHPNLTEWSKVRVAQLRYSATTHHWSLYWADRNGRWHRYDDLDPGPLDTVLDEIEADWHFLGLTDGHASGARPPSIAADYEIALSTFWNVREGTPRRSAGWLVPRRTAMYQDELQPELQPCHVLPAHIRQGRMARVWHGPALLEPIDEGRAQLR
jgi:DUF3024 family protein